MAISAMGIWPGPNMLVASLGIALTLVPWAFLRRGLSRTLVLIGIYAVVTGLLYSDILYFRQFGDLVSVASLRFAGQLGTVGDSLRALVRPGDLWFWIDLPVILLGGLLADLGLPRFSDRLGGLATTRLRPRWAALAAGAGALIVGLTAWYNPGVWAKWAGHSMVVSQMGPLNYHLFDVGAYAGRMAVRLTPSDEAVSDVKAWFGNRGGAAPSPLHGVVRGKNVIVLQVESLQAFTLGLRVDGQEVTPNMNRLAKESLFYTDFYTQSGQGATADADLLANCSLYPTRTGAVYYDYAANDFRCMPTLLREDGYKAVAMQGMPPDFWNLSAVYPQVGFEQFQSIKDFKFDEQIGIGLSDESFLRQAIPKLKALPKPYYAFLVTLTSHLPFEFEGLPKTLNLGNLEGTYVGNYLHTVHYTDRAIGQFVDALKAEGMLDDAVLVLYGDHAGVFRTSSGMDELLGIPPQDEVRLTEMEKHVPLMIRLPGGQAAGERKGAAGEVDIAPTLAGLLGVPTDSVWFMGRDLLSQPSGVVPFYTGSAMTDTHLFVFKGEDGGPGECYDRASGAKVELKDCMGMAEDAARRLQISREIVERNLIPALRGR